MIVISYTCIHKILALCPEHIKRDQNPKIYTLKRDGKHPRLFYQLRKSKLKIEKFTDVCMTGGMHTPSHTKVCKFFNFQLTVSQLILHLKC